MLLTRIITAIILIPLVLWAVIKLPDSWFCYITCMIFAYGAYEWAGLCHLNKLEKVLFMSLFILFAPLLIVFMWWEIVNVVIILGALFWCLAAYWVVVKQPKVLNSKWIKALIGLIALSSAAVSLCQLRLSSHLGPLWIIMLFVLVWGADSFAYFIGRKWGKTPLAAHISPKKTLAGFWGGLICTLICSAIIFVALKGQSFTQGSLMPFSAWISISYITLLLCVLGDLFESLVKRLSGVKDSGQILPGHGGLLDRIDSLLAALPFYTLSIFWVTK